MAAIKEKDFYINKKIIACEDYGMKHNIQCGRIQKIENNLVYIFADSNPEGYENYAITYNNFIKWIKEDLYRIKA